MTDELCRAVPGRSSRRWTAALSLLLLGLVPVSCDSVREEVPSSSTGQEPPNQSRIQTVDLPSGPGALAPRLTSTEEALFLTWLEPMTEEAGDRGRHHRFRVSRLEGDEGTWSDPVTIHEGPDFFANWADVPGVVRDPEGDLVAWWLQMLGEGTYAYGVRLARSPDDGKSWEEVGWLHDDTSPTEHGFVSWVPEDGGLRAFWLDGRSMAVDSEHRVRGAMEIRTARVSAGEPGSSVALDSRTCECCDTDAARAGDGSLVVYRDRSPTEIRDVAIVQGTGPDGWHEPRLVHSDGWKIAGCPVNGPAVAVRDRRTAVAWFTAAEGSSRVLASFSGGHGEAFGEPILLDGENPVGRVDAVFDPGGDLRVSWLGRTEAGGQLRLARIDGEGLAEPILSVAETSTGRSAGVPSLARHGDTLWLVWIEEDADEPVRLRGARIR